MQIENTVGKIAEQRRTAAFKNTLHGSAMVTAEKCERRRLVARLEKVVPSKKMMLGYECEQLQRAM
jgi:hypothetical protein